MWMRCWYALSLCAGWRGSVLLLSLSAPVLAQNRPARSAPQASPSPALDLDALETDLATVRIAVQAADSERQAFGTGLIPSLVELRLATLRQTEALLQQRLMAARTRTSLQFTVDGRPLTLPADAAVQRASVEQELTALDGRIAEHQAEAERYGPGLIRATALSTVATMRQTRAMLDQKRLALRYGLPQFVAFREQSAAAPPAVASPRASVASDAVAPPPTLPATCLKVVFTAYCLGAPTATLPPNPARKEADAWYYIEPQPTVVSLVDGRIAVVGRIYTPASWLTYRGLEQDLMSRYGSGEDRSDFPSYADDEASRETSITLGKGRAVRHWQQSGFTIQLKWTDDKGVVLLYFFDQLHSKLRAKQQEQY